MKTFVVAIVVLVGLTGAGFYLTRDHARCVQACNRELKACRTLAKGDPAAHLCRQTCK